MRFKKITSVLTAITCCSCMFAYMPSFVQDSYASEIVHNDFEVTYEGWHGTDYVPDITIVVGYADENSIDYNGYRIAFIGYGGKIL